jgi:hypothetical protein
MPGSRSLVTFAFVREALEKGDIVAGLFPLFAPAIKRRSGKIFDPQVFARDLDELYSLAVPPFVIEDWAPRMAQAGLLITRDRQSAGDARFVSYVCADPNVPNAADIESRIVHLFGMFSAYARPLFEENGLEVPASSDLERALVKRIQSTDFQDILSKPERTIDLPTQTRSKRRKPSNVQHAAQLMDVVCASFLIDLRRNDPEQFEFITDLAGGALAAEVVLSFRVPPKTGSSFAKMQVFLDSPLILDLLDVGTREEQEFADYLLKALKSEGARLVTFDHNVREITEIVNNVNQAYERRQEVSGQIGARLRTDRNAILKVKQILGNPLRKIKDLGIDVTDAKAIDRPYLKFFSDDDERDLISKIRPFGKIEARAVDAASIASFIRYLYGRRPQGGLMAHEKLFVTKNTGLVRAANEYMRQLNGVELRDGPIISDRSMAGTLWVATGGKGTDLPLHKLLASCTAAVRPRRDVIDKVRDVLRTVSPEEARAFEAMITDERCTFSLMRSTLGDAALISGATTERVLREMKSAMSAEVTKLKDEELRRQKHFFEERINTEIRAREADRDQAAASAQEITAELERVTKEAQAAQRQQLELLDKVSKLEAQKVEEERTIVTAAFERSRYAEWFVYAAFFIPITLAAYILSDYSGKLDNWTWFLGYLGFFLLGLVQFALFPNILFGRWARRLRERFFHRALRRRGLAIYANCPIDWTSYSIRFD